MTENKTDGMRRKAMAAALGIDPEELQKLHDQLRDIQDTATSIQILVQDVTGVTDFNPPLVLDLRTAQRSISAVSEDMSRTAQLLDDQVRRITSATDDVLTFQVRHIRKLIAAGILLCNLPGTLGVALLAWRAGLL